MTGTRPSDVRKEVTPPDSSPPDRLAIVRQRLADGFYRRPEVLDRVAAAIRRALGRRD
jgi:hypothetical protein